MEKALKLVVQGVAEAHELETSREALVSELKKQIREQLEDMQGSRVLKLIHADRALQDWEQLGAYGALETQL